MGCSSGKTTPSTTKSKLLHNYTLNQIIGQGGNAIVYSCTRKGTGEEYAVKMIDRVECALADIKREEEMLRKLAHPCVVKLHNMYSENTFVCLVLDIYKGGSVLEGVQLHWNSLGVLPMCVIGNVVKQMTASIGWLHKNSVIHRDVKSDNYLMDRKHVNNPRCRIVLSDFGTACDLKEGDRLNSMIGTKAYWAPERYSRDYGLKADVWAAGVVMYGLVTGMFPFKCREDVTNTDISIPPQASEDCGDLLRMLLRRNESERPSAGQALSHAFLVSVKPPERRVKKKKMDFEPDLRETGADAGIAERRQELVGRLEDANAPAGGRRVELEDLRQRAFFEVVVKQTERSSRRFEWWSYKRAKEHDLVDITGARPWRDDDVKHNAEASAESIRRILEEHNIRTDRFGEGQAKKLEEFLLEVQSGSSRLMLDATRHKSIVRVVDVVLLRIVYEGTDGRKFLVQSSEKFPDGRDRLDINQLPGTKKEPHENSMQTAGRIVADKLQFTDCKIKFDFTANERFEDREDSPSYPGVQTVYRKEIFEGQVTATDAKVLQSIGLSNGSGWSARDSRGYHRTFCWLTEQRCMELKIKLQVTPEASDISALVHAPIGIGEEDLKKFLEANNVDVSKFGDGTNKSLKEFSDQLIKGEAALVRQPNGKIVRHVDVVILKVSRGNEVLVNSEESSDDAKTTLNNLPAIKRRPDENIFLAAHDLIAKFLNVNDNFIAINPNNVEVAEEEHSSTDNGLLTVYRKHIISAELLMGDDSKTVCV